MLAKLLAAILQPPRFVGARRKQFDKTKYNEIKWRNTHASFKRAAAGPSGAHIVHGPFLKAPSRPCYRLLLLLLSQLIYI